MSKPIKSPNRANPPVPDESTDTFEERVHAMARVLVGKANWEYSNIEFFAEDAITLVGWVDNILYHRKYEKYKAELSPEKDDNDE